MPSRIPTPPVLVTSGPTRAPIDAVRYMANTSSGALGAAIVDSLVAESIPVIHLYGSGSVRPRTADSSLVESLECATVDDVLAALEYPRIRTAAAVVHAMAVLDYVPERPYGGKKASGDAGWTIRLKPTPKITPVIRELVPDALFIGFKLETGVTEAELVRRAGVSRAAGNLDMVVANDLENVGGGRHEALFVGRDGSVVDRAATKRDIAQKLAAMIAGHLKRSERG